MAEDLQIARFCDEFSWNASTVASANEDGVDGSLHPAKGCRHERCLEYGLLALGVSERIISSRRGASSDRQLLGCFFCWSFLGLEPVR